MKKIFLIMMLLATPAWADDSSDIKSLEAKIESQQKKIDMLEKRLTHDEDVNYKVEGQIIGMIHNQPSSLQPSAAIASQETPSQAFNRIQAESQRNEMDQDIESNRNEIFRMQHGY